MLSIMSGFKTSCGSRGRISCVLLFPHKGTKSSQSYKKPAGLSGPRIDSDGYRSLHECPLHAHTPVLMGQGCAPPSRE